MVMHGANGHICLMAMMQMHRVLEEVWREPPACDVLTTDFFGGWPR